MFECAKELREYLRGEADRLEMLDVADLAELLEMQQALDESILKNKDMSIYPEEKIEIALFVELGEMLNELPYTFKYWKDTAKNNRNKAIMEYVDASHFALSLTNNNAGEILNAIKDGKLEVQDYSYEINAEHATEYHVTDLHYFLQEITTTREEVKIGYLFDMGNLLGFKWREIYNAYKIKNSVNHERLQCGY